MGAVYHYLDHVTKRKISVDNVYFISLHDTFLCSNRTKGRGQNLHIDMNAHYRIPH